MSTSKTQSNVANPKKRVLKLIIAFGSPIITSVLTIWLFTLHGTLGLFLWFPVFTYLLLIIIAFAIIGPLILFLNRKITKTRKTMGGLLHKFTKIAWCFCLISLIVSCVTFVYVGGTLVQPMGNTDPQLLICDGSGKYKVPDMAVTYCSQRASKDTLEWGKGGLEETLNEKEKVTIHVFVLEDLKPNTEYWYQINGEGDTYKFTTPLTNNTLKFAVSSDPHFGSDNSASDVTKELLKQITNHENELFFMLGDFVEYGFMRNQWEFGLNTISEYTSEIPFRPILGNHDTIFAGVQNYMDYFYPSKMPVDMGSRIWYHIKVGNINFFLMDLEWGTETYTQEQKEWFEDEIKDVNKDDWTIVMSHCFYYSSGNIDGGKEWYDDKEMIDAFVDIFEENDVDLVFSGHDHHIEILEKGGISYQIIGALGGLPDRKREYESDYSKWYMNIENKNDFGFFEVNILGDNATLTVRNRNYDSLQEIVVQQ